MTELADCRGIWAAMGSGRSMTLDELQMIADVLPADSVGYLELLIRHEYAAIVGIKRAASGEALTVFRLTKRTGPEAPYLHESGRLIDPNLEARSAPQHRRGAFKAAVRLAAERIPGPFTSRQLRDALRDWPESRSKKFDSIWAQLKRSGEVVRDTTEYPDEAQCWIYRPNRDADAIRRYLKARLGESVSIVELKAAVETINGGILRTALNLLTAEGFSVSVTPVKKDIVSYRVDAAQEVVAGEAQCA